MRKFVVLVVSLVVIGCASQPPRSASEPAPSGRYRGDIRTKSGVELVEIELDPSRAPGAWLVQPVQMPLPDVRMGDGEIAFSSPDGVPCRARMSGGAIVTTDGAADCFVSLVRIDPFADESRIAGAYRTADGRLFGLGQVMGGRVLVMTDYATGNMRMLYHRGGGRFTFGPGMAEPAPVAGEVRVAPPYRTMSLAYGSAPAVTAARVDVREQPFAWQNGDASLRGTLILPQGSGPFPAVVITHGSGTPSLRDAQRPLGHWFAAHGVAALTYDRRGSGESTGDARNAGFPDLADDAVRAAEELARMPEIDGRRIGVWGQSQGGWVAPLAAARSPRVAWVIAVSGPAVSANEQEAYRAERQPRAYGLTEEEIAEAVAYYRQVERWRLTGEGRDELVALANRSRDKRWASILGLVDDSLPQRLPERRRDQFWFYDPLPDFRKVSVPILLIYGERDALVPVEKSAALWRSVLAESGNRNGSVVVLDRVTHEMWSGERDTFAEMTRSPGNHARYWPAIEQFLRQHVLSR